MTEKTDTQSSRARHRISVVHAPSPCHIFFPGARPTATRCFLGPSEWQMLGGRRAPTLQWVRFSGDRSKVQRSLHTQSERKTPEKEYT